MSPPVAAGAKVVALAPCFDLRPCLQMRFDLRRYLRAHAGAPLQQQKPPACSDVPNPPGSARMIKAASVSGRGQAWRSIRTDSRFSGPPDAGVSVETSSSPPSSAHRLGQRPLSALEAAVWKILEQSRRDGGNWSVRKSAAPPGSPAAASALAHIKVERASLSCCWPLLAWTVWRHHP